MWSVLYSILSSFNKLYYKTKIYRKIQREKLYNLERSSCFTVTLFSLQNEQNSERPNLDVAKTEPFLLKVVFIFAHAIFLLLDMIIRKAKYPTRCSMKSSTIYKEQL